MSGAKQLDLFSGQSLNPIYELKDLIRSEMSRSSLSRDQIVDQMNELAGRKNLPGRISKSTLDAWCKISDLSRLPSPVQLMLLCVVLKTNIFFKPLVYPLGSELISPEEKKILNYGKAELKKKKAAKEVRRALEEIE